MNKNKLWEKQSLSFESIPVEKKTEAVSGENIGDKPSNRTDKWS